MLASSRQLPSPGARYDAAGAKLGPTTALAPLQFCTPKLRRDTANRLTTPLCLFRIPLPVQHRWPLSAGSGRPPHRAAVPTHLYHSLPGSALCLIDLQ